MNKTWTTRRWTSKATRCCPDEGTKLAGLLEPLRAVVHDPATAALIAGDGGLSPAGQVGAARARLQHIAALEMLRAQQDGRGAEVREWRSLITLPRYADGEENAMLLQTVSPEQLRQAAVSKALAREYVSWQSTRARQILDYMREGTRRGDATANFVARFGAEVTTLVKFPAAIYTDAALPAQTRVTGAVPVLAAPLDTPISTGTVGLLAAGRGGDAAQLVDRNGTWRGSSGCWAGL